MRQLLVLALLLVALLGAGCLGAFRVHVSDEALDAAQLDWEVETFDETGKWYGLKMKETRYIHLPEDRREPPFPAELSVFSVRGTDATNVAFLMARAHVVVDVAIEKEGVQIDESRSTEGTRTIRSGAETQWFVREGSIESGAGDFFNPEGQIKVRIMAEVGSDGRGSTGFIAVAFVKIEDHQDGIAGLPGSTTASESTWFDVVADPEGSIAGASFSSPKRGLLYNMVTNG
jgi:hypothetical protein